MRHVCYYIDPSPLPHYTSTLSLHDALPISELLALVDQRRTPQADQQGEKEVGQLGRGMVTAEPADGARHVVVGRSEEHTSELQSRPHLVCRLLLEKKNKSKQLFCISINTHT